MAVGYDTFVADLDRLKGIAGNGAEFWRGRQIQPILGYTVCDSGGVDAGKHFVESGNMVAIGMGAQRERADWILSRYACYLIAMNGDGAKPEVGFLTVDLVLETLTLPHLRQASPPGHRIASR